MASLSFPPDFHRLHSHQLAWRTIAFGDRACEAVSSLAGDDRWRLRAPRAGWGRGSFQRTLTGTAGRDRSLACRETDSELPRPGEQPTTVQRTVDETARVRGPQLNPRPPVTSRPSAFLRDTTSAFVGRRGGHAEREIGMRLSAGLRVVATGQRCVVKLSNVVVWVLLDHAAEQQRGHGGTGARRAQALAIVTRRAKTAKRAWSPKAIERGPKATLQTRPQAQSALAAKDRWAGMSVRELRPRRDLWLTDRV